VQWQSQLLKQQSQLLKQQSDLITQQLDSIYGAARRLGRIR